MQHEQHPDGTVQGSVGETGLWIADPEHQETRGIDIETDRAALATMLLLVSVLVGCATRAALPAAPSQATPTVPSTTGDASGGGVAGRLVSQRVDAMPAIDGEMEEAWADAEPLRVPLSWGVNGTEHALDVELRALHTGEAISFLAQWSGEPPSGEQDAALNKFTFHWRVPEPAASRLDCTVVCHTAFADGSGRFIYANTETIPQGGGKPLESGGRWNAGTWTLEWSRPLVSSNPFDVQLDDPDQAYTFRIKVFERVEGRPDPVSARYLLVFHP